MAKTLDEAGVKRLIQEIKGANKNLNAPIPISTENTTESMAQNVKNIADYVEKAKAAGIANVDGMGVTCLINGGISGLGYIYVAGNSFELIGMTMEDDMVDNAFFIVREGEFNSRKIAFEGTVDTVTSDMLVEGARKPIIITEDMTEVDEETYQKLSQEGTDVILSLGGGTFVELQGIFNTGDTLNLIFGYSQFDESNDGVIATYTITINTSAPHTLTLAVIGTCEPVSKSILSPILQEIDLTGTDADRKAKLDKFETDWKALTGASDLTGARFVGKFGITEDIERNVTGIMTYCAGDEPSEKNDNHFYGICNGYSFSEQKSQIAVKVSCTDGSITITPLFSHLEAITIYTDNTPEHKQANLDNIAAYEANLQALGVDVTKGYMIPICFSDTELGYVMYHPFSTGSKYTGIVTGPGGASSNIAIGKNGYAYVTTHIQPVESSSLTTTAKAIVPAINEVNANAVHSDKLVPTLEAISIKTNNTTESKAANVAAIKAYVDNLIALGVDVTKGYMIPIRTSSEENTVGFIIPNTTDTGYVGLGEIGNGNGITLYISNDGNVSRYRLQEKSDDDLTTTTNNIVGAINEVNALAKGYSTIFTPIELTTETAQNKTAIDARVAAFTAQGISLTNGCCIPVTYKGVYAGNISLINGDWYGLLVKNTNNPADNINIKLSADGTITEGNSAQ